MTAAEADGMADTADAFEGGPSGGASRNRAVPGWLIIVAVVLTVVITIWILTKKNPGIWQSDSKQPPPLFVGSSPALAINDHYQLVAGGGAPTITAGSIPPHGDRGPCTRCHAVVDNGGRTIAPLHYYSNLPHPHTQGLCINCHTTLPPGGGQVATNGWLAPTQQGQGPRGNVTEADWMGMEVSPISPVTAQQFSIPVGATGVVITEVEGRAKKAGLKPGDVVVSVSGAPVGDPGTFAKLTRNGELKRGTVQVQRGGRFMEAGFGTARPPQRPPENEGARVAQPQAAMNGAVAPPRREMEGAGAGMRNQRMGNQGMENQRMGNQRMENPVGAAMAPQARPAPRGEDVPLQAAQLPPPPVMDWRPPAAQQSMPLVPPLQPQQAAPPAPAINRF